MWSIAINICLTRGNVKSVIIVVLVNYIMAMIIITAADDNFEMIIVMITIMITVIGVTRCGNDNGYYNSYGVSNIFSLITLVTVTLLMIRRL